MVEKADILDHAKEMVNRQMEMGKRRNLRVSWQMYLSVMCMYIVRARLR